MSDADLIDKISAANSISKAHAKAIIDSGFTSIAAAVKAWEEVPFKGSGKFRVKDCPASEGRNSPNGEAMQIAASKKIGFTAADALIGEHHRLLAQGPGA